MSSYSNYDIREDDPYLIDGSSCLKNLLGFTDTASLNLAEEQLTQLMMADLVNNPVEPTFDLNHLKAIHHKIFQDVFPFAGQVRTTEILKGGKLFLPYQKIEHVSKAVFDELHRENLLKGLGCNDFGKRAGYFLGRINMIHPFREGNGRTQRVLLNQLADLNHYAIEWAAISGESMAKACREARTTDPSGSQLQHLISLHVVSPTDRQES